MFRLLSPFGHAAEPAVRPQPPAPPAEDHDPLASYRCDDPIEVATLLHELRDLGKPLSLTSPQGLHIGATVWNLDEAAGRLSLDIERSEPGLEALVAGDEVTAVGYLEAIKLQFELSELMLLRSDRATALQARMPACIYRFQRRASFRVSTQGPGGPVARMRHPGFPEMSLALRVLDVSMGGCAVLLPADVPPLPVGVHLPAVRLELNASLHLGVGMTLQHASSIAQAAGALRLGCELDPLSPMEQRHLQRYIDNAQRRRRVLSLG